MILRRIADAMKRQDWFVVVVEILIVVIGIVIGLQVDDWNEARKDRADEVVFMVRLHEDILNAEALSSRVLGRRLEYWEHLPELTDLFFNHPEVEELSGNECQYVASLHYLNVVVSDLSAVRELASTGRMGIIQNQDIRTALGRLQQAEEAVNNLIRVQQASLVILPKVYPGLITRDSYYDEDFEEIRGHFTCDLKGMRKNRAFLNDFSANTDVYDGYIQDALKPWADQFKEVHRLVDEELGIGHGEQGQ